MTARGMSPGDRNATIDVIVRVKNEDRLTIMLTEHDMDVVAHLFATRSW